MTTYLLTNTKIDIYKISINSKYTKIHTKLNK